ncbi:glycosyltransferase [Shewanella oncorhynchi]|uniref:glycosyltransferase n=1 Tax=Shewanella oncorhynchi TaxID=2726434 RepID=UPI003D79C9F5
MKLSVIASVYSKEKPRYLEEALSSISEQTRLPDEVIIVIDGPVSSELSDVIDVWSQSFPNKVIILRHTLNKGLAVALNYALSHSSGDFIARVDTDDISLPDRFKEQLSFLITNSDVDVVGSNISEIDDTGKIIKENVYFPEFNDDCRAFFSKRDPLAHPATMFRESFFRKAGRYDEQYVGEKNYEDTMLWYQGFKHGCKFANIQKDLIYFRRTESFYSRRGGLKKSINFLRDRWRIVRDLDLGYLGYIYAFCYFVLSILPSKLKKIAYNNLR